MKQNGKLDLLESKQIEVDNYLQIEVKDRNWSIWRAAMADKEQPEYPTYDKECSIEKQDKEFVAEITPKNIYDSKYFFVTKKGYSRGKYLNLE